MGCQCRIEPMPNSMYSPFSSAVRRIRGQIIIAEGLERRKLEENAGQSPTRPPGRARRRGPVRCCECYRIRGPVSWISPYGVSFSASSLAMRHQVTALSGRWASVWLSFMMSSTTQPRVFARISRIPRRMASVVQFGNRQRGRVGLHGEDVLVAQVGGHLLHVHPCRARHAAEMRMLLDDVPAAVQRFAAAVAGQAEPLHDRLLVGEDELLVHRRARRSPSLGSRENPHMSPGADAAR